MSIVFKVVTFLDLWPWLFHFSTTLCPWPIIVIRFPTFNSDHNKYLNFQLFFTILVLNKRRHVSLVCLFILLIKTSMFLFLYSIHVLDFGLYTWWPWGSGLRLQWLVKLCSRLKLVTAVRLVLNHVQRHCTCI